MTSANIEAAGGALFKPVSYEIKTGETDYKNKDDVSKESIFAQKETISTNAYVAKEETNEEESFFDSFLESVKGFFSSIFSGIGNFFKGLFSKEDENDTPNEDTVESDTVAEDEDDDFSTEGKEIIKELDINTKDGEIGYTKQSSETGDCWALAGINALSYTEEGRKIIKDALEYKDGYTIVHLKGAGDYTIKDKEVEATQYIEDYSSGDWDMVILELAIEKAVKDIADGKTDISEAPWSVQSAFEQTGDQITGGCFETVFYLITGKEADYYSSAIDNIINSGDIPQFSHYAGTREEMLNEFKEDNGENIAIGAQMSSIIFKPGTAFYPKDVNGETIPVYTAHGYALKEVRDDNVVITNPWDTSKEIEFSKETFFNTFNDYYSLDLSEDEN